MNENKPVSNRPRNRSQSGAAFVFDVLREEIIALVLPPGTILSRADLQERFGLSSTPVRDALMRLEDEGLVDVFPQHATMVSPIDIERARQGQLLRRSVELELVRMLALDPRPEIVARLKSLIRQQEAFVKLGEREAFSTADQAFHALFYEHARAGDLLHLVRRHGGHIDRLRRLHLPVAGKTDEIIRAHRTIVERIEARDAGGAQEALRDHLSRSLDFVETLRRTNPEYFRG